MSRRDRRQHSRKRPDVELEDFDGCKTLALRIVHATLTREHPDEHARVLSAILAVIERPPETVTTVINYVAQVASEHFQFGCVEKMLPSSKSSAHCPRCPQRHPMARTARRRCDRG